MARISGKWEEGTGLKVWKNIRLSINKYSKLASEEIVNRARYDLERWEDDVLAEISDPLAKEEWGSLRDPTRMFPYLNTGNQAASVNSGVKSTSTGAGNYSITSWAEIGAEYLKFTNAGLPRRKDKKKPRWIGWVDDVFYGTRGFFSVADVFDRLTVERGAVR